MYGVDLDARAVAVARDAIAALTGAPPPVDHLRVGDALALDWAAAFPAGTGFDAVVGNPPYIRQELLAAAKPALRAYEV